MNAVDFLKGAGLLLPVCAVIWAVAAAYFPIKTLAEDTAEEVEQHEELLLEIQETQEVLSDIHVQQATAAEAEALQLEKWCRKDLLKDRSECPMYQPAEDPE